MSEHNNDSFRGMNKKEKMATTIRIVLLIILVIGFVFGIYFFGLAGLFEVLGVHYESVWSLVIFVLGLLFIGIIFEVFSKVVFKLTVRNMSGKAKILFIQFIIESITNWVVLFTVDELMTSITLSLNTEVIIAVFIALFEIAFTDDKEVNEDKAA